MAIVPGNASLAALSLRENMTSYLKMAIVPEKAMCILRFFETNSDNNLESPCIFEQNINSTHFVLLFLLS
jgi:hypothetical protein